MLKSVGSNWARIIVAILVNFFLTPFLIRKLGVDLYGSWAVISAYTGWLVLMQVGIPMASVRLFAQSIGKGDIPGLNRAVATSLRVSIIVGLVAALGGGVLFTIYNCLNVSKVSAAHIADARIAFFIVVLQLIIGFACQIPYGIMAAHQDFPVSNLISISGILLRLVALTAIMTSTAASLALIATVNLAVSLFEGVVGLCVVRMRYPGIRPRGGLDRTLVKTLLSFSGYVLLLNVGNQLAFSTDSIVISSLIDNKSVTSFENGKMFVIYLTEFIVAIGAVVMPLTVKLETQGKHDDIRLLLRKWLKASLSLSLLPGLYLVVFGEAFIKRWIDAPGFDSSAAGMVLSVLMVSHFAFLPARGVALPIIMGLGRPAAVTVAFAISSVVNLGLSISLARPLGLLGIALGTAIPEVVFALYAIWVSCRLSGSRCSEIFQHAVVRTVPGAMIMLSFLVLVSKLVVPSTWFLLIAIGVAYLVVFAIVWAFYVYRADSDFDPCRFLKKQFLKRSTC